MLCANFAIQIAWIIHLIKMKKCIEIAAILHSRCTVQSGFNCTILNTNLLFKNSLDNLYFESKMNFEVYPKGTIPLSFSCHTSAILKRGHHKVKAKSVFSEAFTTEFFSSELAVTSDMIHVYRLSQQIIHIRTERNRSVYCRIIYCRTIHLRKTNSVVSLPYITKGTKMRTISSARFPIGQTMDLIPYLKWPPVATQLRLPSPSNKAAPCLPVKLTAGSGLWSGHRNYAR